MSSKTSQDAAPGTTDIANLIKTAGSPEAVIQYLLKEKHSQSQQNAQLWRLVDKQRAMILGLNKDLERALKDKEKYRKKMKELMVAQEAPSKIETQQPTVVIPRQVDVRGLGEQAADVPTSPSNLDTDSIKNSPVDMAMAPYPITPPADRGSNGPMSAVGEILDPSHSMPKPSEHALGHFDHEEDDRAADEATKAAQAAEDSPILLFNTGLPPSRSLPSAPPSVPPPKPPITSKESAPLLDQTISQFPPPSAPPPRKPPPAPLQLRKEAQSTLISPPEDENDSDSDYDSLLDVDELPVPTESRGRRRTRDEDDVEREKLAQLEAERRSLSKKQKGSQKGTPKEPDLEPPQDLLPASPRSAGSQPMLVRNNIPASLAGILSGSTQSSPAAPLMSPGLPSSPRPMGMSSATSPPLSPRGVLMSAAPLSPRAPRQPIPLPPNTPSTSPSAAEPLGLTSPKPLNITKMASETGQQSPTGSRESASERSRIYKGFVTEELPDLLLPPNALFSVEVKVASSRMKPSRASLISLTQLEEDPVFTLAIFSRAEGGELWRVEKDTISLAKLDQKLKQCSAFTARTPDRSLFSGHAPAKLDARRIALNLYLDELLNTPLDIGAALELCKYLSTNTLPPNADETGSAVDSSSEISTLKTGAGGRPLKSGYLTKRGKNFGGWKARFFILDGPLLKYYETPGGAHLGTIKLQNAQIGKQSQSNNEGSPAGTSNDEMDNQYRHAFLVLEPKKKDSSSHVKHVLCAESDHERDQWVETLLRWIDYKDPVEEVSKAKTEHDRHGSGSTPQAKGVSAKKKQYGQVTKAHNDHSASQDGLIGISYEGTSQGDVPDGVPPRRRNTETPDSQQERVVPSSYTISAPRDPQVISDTAIWGAKAALAPPGISLEEKKQRKRSFFGFGPKTRSSSDDQDSLFSASSQSVQGNEYRGPVRQSFGAPLAEAVRYCGPTDVNVPLPAVVFRCIQYLEAKNAIFEEGIFRLSGSNVVIKALRERFNVEGDINLLTDETYYDIHAVASLLKLYLRELPTTILTRDLHLQFLTVTEMSGQREKIAALSELVQLLPQSNGTLLRYLIAFLVKINNNADMNKMTVRNVGIVFSPTLNIPAPVFALLLQNFEAVFGIAPEDYELPSPVSESDLRPLVESQARRPASRAGATTSPQRPRFMEQTQQQRSTPTPPPAIISGSGRSTATPPPVSRQMGYEPQYLAQQPNGSQTSLRPAYESGYMPPTNYDPNARQLATNGQLNYDRSHYQTSYEQDYSDYDQPHAARAKRRESAMFMGNMMLNQQGSKSRLRE
ncbi:hypothetical protein TruAng_002211 [Truncatella angustata]|nr:hypothetical protein TruAng_002211 [Truncatella angustata]